MKDSTTVLKMQDVGKSFQTPSGRVEVLRHVNLSISQGDFIAITGPSGSGKSTLLHLSALLDYPSSGRIFFDGQDVSALKDRGLCYLRKNKVGMVFQKYCLLPHRSVFENVIFRFRYIKHYRAEAECQALHALKIVGLIDIADRTARLLSGGEMQRTAIARAIVLKPRLLIADEPTGNLDSVSTQAVMECFERLNNTGITILMVTHNQALLKFCMRQIVCHDGCITEEKSNVITV